MKKLLIYFLVLFLVCWFGRAIWDTRDYLGQVMSPSQYYAALQAEREIRQLQAEELEKQIILNKLDVQIASLELEGQVRQAQLLSARVDLAWDTVNDALPSGLKEAAVHLASFSPGKAADALDLSKNPAVQNARRKVEHLEDLPAQHETQLQTWQNKASQLRGDIEQLQEKRQALDAKAMPWGELMDAIQVGLFASLYINWLWAIKTAFILLFLPLAWRIFNYYALAPLIERLAPVSIFDQREVAPRGERAVEVSQKLVSIELPPGGEFTVRNEDFIGGYQEYAGSRLRKRTRLLFDWHYPLMSFFCGLTLMVRFSNRSEQSHRISITSNAAAEYFPLLPLALAHPYVTAPPPPSAFSAAARAPPPLLFYLPAWCMGQVRYYLLSGQGSIIVRAEGGLTAYSLKPGECGIRNKRSLVSSTQGVELHVRRTETFVPYFLGLSDLYDMRLSGQGDYYVRNTMRQARTVSEKVSHVFWTCLGKFLGF